MKSKNARMGARRGSTRKTEENAAVRGGRVELSFLRLSSYAFLLILVGSCSWIAGRRNASSTLSVLSCTSPRLERWKAEIFGRAMTLSKRSDFLARKQEEPEGHLRFSLFDSFDHCKIGNPSKVGGEGDGGKFLCMSMISHKQGCLVISLGSAGNFLFEEDILRRTNCRVISLDCTVPGQSIHPRHSYIQKCLGSAERMREDPRSWVTIDELTRQYGSIDVLKMDIEGYEYDVMASWKASSADALPSQIAMEIHYLGIYHGTEDFENKESDNNLIWPPHIMGVSDLALFVSHMANMGYSIVSKEDNPICPHCSEYLFQRVCE